MDEGHRGVDRGGDVAVRRVQQGPPTTRPRTAGSASAADQLSNVSSGLSEGSPPSSRVGSVVASMTRAISATTGSFSQV